MSEKRGWRDPGDAIPKTLMYVQRPRDVLSLFRGCCHRTANLVIVVRSFAPRFKYLWKGCSLLEVRSSRQVNEGV